MAKSNVLHADDVEQWRLYVREALSEICDVHSVNDCDGVLPRLAEGGIDLVVLDLLMPGEPAEADGHSVLTDIRESYPDIPVVMFTGGTIGAPVTCEELEEQWQVAVVFKHDEDPAAMLLKKVRSLLES